MDVILIGAQVKIIFTVFVLVPTGLAAQIETAVKVITEPWARGWHVLRSSEQVRLGAGHICKIFFSFEFGENVVYGRIVTIFIYIIKFVHIICPIVFVASC